MITFDQKERLLTLTVFGEFALADFKEFEQGVAAALSAGLSLDLLVDLRQMVHFTVDMVLEELRFGRAQAKAFRRIAVLTHSPWVALTSWLERAFVSADMESFADEDDARLWLMQGAN